MVRQDQQRQEGLEAFLLSSCDAGTASCTAHAAYLKNALFPFYKNCGSPLQGTHTLTTTAQLLVIWHRQRI
jgi:hypothetical protein